MAGGVIRFGVRSDDGRRSGVVRVWANPNSSDVYVAARSIAGEFKASLHESGHWQVGFTAAHVGGRSPRSRSRGPVVDVEDRILDRWQRPRSPHPGLTRAFAIVVVAEGALLEEQPDDARKEIVWYPKPASSPSVEFNIFLTSPDCVVSTWPGQRGMGSAFIGSFELANGETVWVTAIEPEELPTLPDSHIPLLEGETKVEAARRLFGNPPYDSLRALAYGKDDEVHWFVETALQITPQEEAPGL